MTDAAPTPAPRAAETVREELAAYAHEAWSGWMHYMLPKLGMVVPAYGGDGWVPSQEAFDVLDRLAEPGILNLWRWIRQMETPYADLPESEKESDRVEADRMLAIVGTAAEATIAELRAIETVARAVADDATTTQKGLMDVRDHLIVALRGLLSAASGPNGAET